MDGGVVPGDTEKPGGKCSCTMVARVPTASLLLGLNRCWGALPHMGLFSAGVWVEEFGDLSTALRPHTPLLQPHGQGNCVPNALIFWEPYWSGWMVAPKDDSTQILRV